MVDPHPALSSSLREEEKAIASGMISTSSTSPDQSSTGVQNTVGDVNTAGGGVVIGGNLVDQRTTVQILAPSLSATKPQHLRAPVSDFVGRNKEIKTLVRALRRLRGRRAIITGIRGMGGLGKTELAYAVASDLRSAYPDGQILVELHGASTNPLSPEEALRAVVQSIEPRTTLPSDIASLQATYRSVLADRRVLIVADDAWGAQQVSALMPPPGSALIITSRIRFHLPGLVSVELNTLTASEAIALVRRICPRVGDAAHRLALLCGYLPLALRVSSALLENDATRRVEEYLQDLKNTRTRLASLRDPRDLQLDVEASLDLSCSRLDEGTRKVLGLVSVFPDSFDHDIATVIPPPHGGITPDSAEGFGINGILGQLYRLSLVEWDGKTERYSLHDLVRAYALTHLWTGDSALIADITSPQEVGLNNGPAQSNSTDKFSGIYKTAEDRYVHFFAQLTARLACLQRRGYDALSSANNDFNDEKENIYSSLWQLTHGKQNIDPRWDALLIIAAFALAYFLDQDDKLGTWAIRSFYAALEAARRLGYVTAECFFLSILGLVRADLGEVKDAVSLGEQALLLARTIGSLSCEGKALYCLGRVHAIWGARDQASVYYNQALSIHRCVNDQRGEANDLEGLASIYIEMAEAAQAIEHISSELKIVRTLADSYRECIGLNDLGRVLTIQGKVQEAIKNHTLALDIAHQLGYRRGTARALVGLGQAYALCEQLEQASACLEEALDIVGQLGNVPEIAITSWELGKVTARLGDMERAGGLMAYRISFERSISHVQAETHVQECAAYGKPEGESAQGKMTGSIVLFPESDDTLKPRSNASPDKEYPILIGRDAELSQMIAALANPTDHWIITVDGLAGVGKTALGSKLFYQCGDERLFERVVWLDARVPTKTPGIGEPVLDWLLNTLALQLDGDMFHLPRRERVIRIQKLLQTHRILMIWDRLDIVSDIQEMIRSELLPFINPSKAILMSRYRFDGDHDAIHLHGLAPEGAYQLLAAELGTDRIATYSTYWNQLVYLTGGIPGALLGIAMQPYRSPASFIKELEMMKPTQSRYEGYASNPSAYLYESVFLPTWSRLSADSKRLLVALSSVSLDTGLIVEAIRAIHPMADAILEQSIEELYRYSFLELRTDAQAKKYRYYLHRVARAFAQQPKDLL